MLVDIQNIVIAIIILFAGLRVYQKYQLTRAREFFWLALGCLYLVIYRTVLIFVAFDIAWRNWLILPFYIIFAISMDRILRILRIYIHSMNKDNTSLINKIKNFLWR